MQTTWVRCHGDAFVAPELVGDLAPTDEVVGDVRVNRRQSWVSRTVHTEPDVTVVVHELARTNARPLLVVHGGPDWDHSYLKEPLEHTADQRRLLLLDLRGCGESTRGLDLHRYTPQAAVEDLIRVLADLDLAQVDVLGFSYGGLLAQRLAAAAPDRVARLVLASTSTVPFDGSWFGDWPERAARIQAAENRVGKLRLTPDYCRELAVAEAEVVIWTAEALPDWRRRLDDIHWSSEWLKALHAGLLPTALPSGGIEALARIGVPVLFLHGRYDMRFPATAAEHAARVLSDAQLALIPDAGHMTHVDQPVAWLDHVDMFLD